MQNLRRRLKCTEPSASLGPKENASHLLRTYGEASGPSVPGAAANWDHRSGRLGAGGKLPAVFMCVRAIVAPSCSAFTISQIGGMMSAMATLASPQKITFAEMRESGGGRENITASHRRRTQRARHSHIARARRMVRDAGNARAGAA
jgi:hypothetical protein